MVKKVRIILFILINPTYAFKIGLENIPQQLKNDLRAKRTRIGLITNQTGVTQDGIRNIDLLRKEKLNLRAILVPEHGLTGKAGNGESINNDIDPISKLPIISLYKGEAKKNTCNKEDLKKLDVLLFDIQDSGMRHYTYISTLFNVLKLGAKHNKPVIVLDRPNPLGSIMEGPLVDPDKISFISIAPVPVRHGMTIGELARYFNTYILEKPAQLTIVPMEGYNRHRGLPKLTAMLSSGLRTKQACYAYSFLGLMGEIKPFFIGLKTDKPFEVLMISSKYKVPTSFWRTLKNIFQRFNIEARFAQVSHPTKQKKYIGFELNIKDINKVHSFELFLTIAQLTQKHNIPISFAPTFNLATGTEKVKQYILGEYSRDHLRQSVNNDLHKFYNRARSSFLYTPTPIMTFL